MMSEARKRAISPSPDNIGPLQKKRNVSTSDSETKPVNGTTEHDDEQVDVWTENLELFRKEAIFRRMQHYAREYTQTSARLQEAEERLRGGEHTVAAVDACWNQTISQALALLPDGLPSISPSSLEIYNMAFTLPHDSDDANDSPEVSKQYYERLRDTSIATQKLLAAFTQLAPKAVSPEAEELQKQCTMHLTESTSLRAETRMLRSRLSKTVLELEDCREQLAVMTNRVERAKSKTVAALESKVEVSKKEQQEPVLKTEDTLMVNGHSPPPTNGTLHSQQLSKEDEEWRDLAVVRQGQINDLERELHTLSEELSRSRLEISNPSDTTIIETIPYKQLLGQLAELKASGDEAKAQAAKLAEEVAQLKESRVEFQSAVEAQAKNKLDEVTQRVTKLNTDNSRLRGARDSATNELAAIKAKDPKMQQKELKSMNEFQKERIAALVRETQRLRACLAVETGDEDFYAVIADNPEENASYVNSLKSRLKDAEARNTALELSLRNLNTNKPDITRHVQSEAEARQLYATAKEKLEKYERVYGSSSGSNGVPPSDAQSLVERLAEKEAALQAIKTLKRQEDERTHGKPNAMDDLSGQVEQLMALREKNLTDLTALEDKHKKISLEKTKADTKYFATMKTKDSLEVMKNNLELTLDKQSKRIQKLLESDQALKQHVQLLEKLGSSAKADLMAGQAVIARLRADMDLVNQKSDAYTKEISELHHQLEQRTQESEEKRLLVRTLQEEAIKLKKAVTRAESKSEHVSTVTEGPSKVSKQNDNLLKILRCSTCNQDFRSHVILKCMHTFCKGCIDARLNGRQRKCPACQMAFGTSDVQSIYFQ
ncbi:E3 ubiquitin-protein ligase bre1 [Tulasnella sp. JGI-2019a]|nr:E3 ubiquitin-protein ligase bre1 [Tulasnella sp. JGI-2019a]KAG9010424.1 E3 ubiquitin-protein ligase bre1 [Tulasnella sp. JGI-2019a]KAG9038716.1 E3 ubiquitin-protein ligase bre1 [Tulasnella sp. JGI-2019a]